MAAAAPLPFVGDANHRAAYRGNGGFVSGSIVASAAAGKLGAASRPLASAREFQEVLEPRLACMKRDLQANWPSMDPELLLVQYLCRRKQLEPPLGSLLRKTAPAPGAAAMDAGVATAATSSTAWGWPAWPGDVGGGGGGRAESGGGGTAGVRLQPLAAPGVPQDVAVTSVGAAAAAAAQEALAAAAEGARDVHTVARQLRERMQQLPQTPRLNHLNRTTELLHTDCLGVVQRQGVIKSKTDNITTQIALMRQSLRGKFVANVPLLSLKVLTEEEQFRLVGRLRPWNFESGQYIMKEGDIGDRLYIIERGVCQVWKNTDDVEMLICNIGKGDFFGEIAVMYDVPRSATILTISDVTVLSLSRDDIHATLSAEKIELMKVAARTQVFASIPALVKLSSSWKVTLAESLQVDRWGPDEMITREGVPVAGRSRRLYILEHGTCSQSKIAEEEQEPQAAELTRGERPRLKKKRSVFLTVERSHQAGSNFGMLELMYGCPWQSTVKTKDQVTTLSISHDELKQVFGEESDELISVMRTSVRVFLLKQVHSTIKSSPEAELVKLLASAQVTLFLKWQPIFKRGQKVTHLCMLEEGVCIESKLEAETLCEKTDAEAECIEHATPGETFGTGAMISRGQEEIVVSSTLIAIAECSILRISISEIARLTKYRERRGTLSSSGAPTPEAGTPSPRVETAS